MIDRDALDADNLMRHEGLPEEVGLRKVELVARRLRRLAPGLAVDALDASLFDEEHAGTIEAMVARADLVLASFDNPAALFRLNALCARHRRPLVVAEVISGGIGVWLLVANHAPGAPCLLDIARARCEDVRTVEATRDAPRVDYADPESVVRAARVPADDWACSFAASLLAREAVLAARAGGVVEPGTPSCRLVALQRVEAPGIAAFFTAPLQVTLLPARSVPECAACGTPAPVPSADEHAARLSFFEPE